MTDNDKMKAHLSRGFSSKFMRQPEAFLFAPGRVNLIGEHIDYCGGLVLPMAIDRGTYGAFAPNDENVVRVFSTRFSEMVAIPVNATASKKHWSDFVVGICNVLNQKYELSGFDIYVDSDVSAGGLSSSASFLALLARAALSIAGIEITTDQEKMKLAQLCQRVENEFVGVASGIMDPVSVIFGEIVKIDCARLTVERAETDLGRYQVVVMDSGKERTLAASKYNERVGEISRIMDLINPVYKLKNLSGLPVEELDNAASLVGDSELVARMRHVATENQRVRMSVSALREGQIDAFGELLNQSHSSLRDDYKVTGFELDTLVEISQKHPGVVGARMTGAGFGGCCIALLEADEVDSHNEQVTTLYKNKTGLDASLFKVEPAMGVDEI